MPNGRNLQTFGIILMVLAGVILSGLFFLPFPAQAVIEDKYYDKQTWLNQIGYADYVQGLSTGEGVVVAIIDSGIWLEHPDLIGSIWVNQGEIPQNDVDDDKNGFVDDYYGWNFIDNSSDMMTKSEHGTQVAGIIAAQHNDFGIAGIAPKSKIMSLIACDENGSCSQSAVLSAIKYAIDNGAKIINLSLGKRGYMGYSSAYDWYIKYAYDRDAVIVAAAGNGDIESAYLNAQLGQNLDFIKASPVSNDVDGVNMVVGVGATKNGAVSIPWSNYGKSVDVWAPGEKILTTTVPAFVEGYGYSIYPTGTSFSAPMVSGAAALLRSKYPNLKNWEIIDYLKSNTNLNISNILKNSLPSCKLNKIVPQQINADESIIISGMHIVSTFKPRLVKINVPSFGRDISKNYYFLDAQQIKIDTLGLKLSSGNYSIQDSASTLLCSANNLYFQIQNSIYDTQNIQIIQDQAMSNLYNQSPASVNSEESLGVLSIQNPINLDEILFTLRLVRNEAEEDKYKPLVESDATTLGVLPTSEQKSAIINFVVYGISESTKQIGAGERRALIRDYFETVGRSEINWEDIERLTIGQKPVARNLSKEQTQVKVVLKVFKKIFGHSPVFSDIKEDLVWNTMLYRIRFNRDLAKEQVGITKFKQIFKYAPKIPLDWAAVRALGYIIY